MSASSDRNRLADEESPYLRQHADNPVHWQPWDEAALQAAADRDVPIFLSIGYSACHWCHVMEEESFADESVASRLNEHFVPIKVDREERPDLDQIYQTICQLVTRRGGWPLSVWLTPDGRPFYVGTYFPKESSRGMPGFVDLLDRIRESWEQDREEIENRADQWTAAITDELESVPSQPGSRPSSDILEEAAGAALRAADREHGGFGESGPKFPQPARLALLCRAADRTDRPEYAAVLTETLDAMAGGGLYDHVGGGFHRYATDRSWTVPHFEKMLYDNAELVRSYLAGYQLTGTEEYARVVRETLEFLTRELTDPAGGFYSTLDAQSGGEEGSFYVWTPAQIEDAVDDEELAALFCDRFGVTAAGNFEGRSVLTVSAGIDELAESHSLEPSNVRDRLSVARERVFEAREGRERPARDEKILAGWNGLAISAFAEAGFVLDPSLGDPAGRALDFVRQHLWSEEENRLYRRYSDGVVKISGYLEDYAFLARGAFDHFQYTGDFESLSFAFELARIIEREFWDPDAGTLYFTPERGESLVTRPQELADQSTPSSVGVAADVLLSLSHFSPTDAFDRIVERVLETHGDRIRASPLEYSTLALVADRYEVGSIEITVAAESLPNTWRDRLASTYIPGRIVARRPPGDDELDRWIDRLGLEAVPPIWADRHQRNDAPTAYVCRSFTCSPPLTDVGDVVDWIHDFGAQGDGS